MVSSWFGEDSKETGAVSGTWTLKMRTSSKRSQEELVTSRDSLSTLFITFHMALSVAGGRTWCCWSDWGWRNIVKVRHQIWLTSCCRKINKCFVEKMSETELGEGCGGNSWHPFLPRHCFPSSCHNTVCYHCYCSLSPILNSSLCSTFIHPRTAPVLLRN